MIIDKQLIVIEGPDGVGKSTQTKFLVEWLQGIIIKKEFCDNVIRAEQFKELNTDDFIFSSLRDFVYSIYKKLSTPYIAEIIKINRYLVYDTLIRDYVYDERESTISNMRLTIHKNIAVVDRWNISTYCYLKAEDFNDEALSYLNDNNTTIPGLTIMLVGDKASTRMANRPENNNMFEDNGFVYNTKLANVYKDFDVDLYKGQVVKINNDDLTKEQTRDIIRDIVFNYLSGIF